MGSEMCIRDRGTAENSYTLVTIGCYLQDKFHILYLKRYEGQEAEPKRTVADIVRLAKEFRVELIGVDYGGGFDRNDALIREFGVRKIIRFQYGNSKRLYFDKTLLRFMVNRTEALMAVLNALGRKDTFVFPKWEDFESPFGTDLLSVHTEYNESRRTMVVTKAPGATDDTLHSVTYCFLASMILHPRPDIITPDKDRN